MGTHWGRRHLNHTCACRLLRDERVKVALRALREQYAMDKAEQLATLGEMGRGNVPTKTGWSSKHGDYEEYDRLSAIKTLQAGSESDTIQVNTQHNIFLEGY